MSRSIDDDIAERLRKLGGRDFAESKGPSVPLTTPKKTEAEQVESLMAEMSALADLEQRTVGHDRMVDVEIEQRLEKLKDETKSLSLNPFLSLSTKKMSISDVVRQVSLERPEPAESSPRDLDWCVICNEDATIYCRGCDNDLYCARCYMEFHEKDELDFHKTTPYRPTASGP